MFFEGIKRIETGEKTPPAFRFGWTYESPPPLLRIETKGRMCCSQIAPSVWITPPLIRGLKRSRQHHFGSWSARCMNHPASIKRIETWTRWNERIVHPQRMNHPTSIKRIETYSDWMQGTHNYLCMNRPASIKRIETYRDKPNMNFVSLVWITPPLLRGLKHHDLRMTASNYVVYEWPRLY